MNLRRQYFEHRNRVVQRKNQPLKNKRYRFSRFKSRKNLQLGPPFFSNKDINNSQSKEFKIGPINFRRREVIGQGTNTAVYKGRINIQQQTRPCAVKRILKVPNQTIYNRREIKIWNQLNRKGRNIVTFYKWEEDDDFWFVTFF